MPVTREQVQAAARKYLGTPFADKGRLLGRGLDCVGLPLMVAGDLNLVDRDGVPLNGASYSTYSAQPQGTYVHDMCMKHLVYKPTREMLPGDVVSLRVVSSPCHVGIITEDVNGRVGLIHAYSGGPGKVIEHLLDVKWQRRIVGCFKYPEVID